VRDEALGLSLLASFLLHSLAIGLASILIHNTNLRREDFFPVSLVEVPPAELSRPLQRIDAGPETKKPSPPPKTERPKQPSPVEKAPVTKPESLPVPIKEELAKAIEAKPPAPTKIETTLTTRVEGGGSEAGAGNLFGKGDVGVVLGTGTAGGGGTAASGLGRGSGAPGLPAQSLLRTNREVKPIQIVRAAYPPMALRAGLESDVMLRIEIDPAGNVTKAEITKSGGSGFDEEALKAVRQSRFEPAQRDGHNVAAEFTYIYRFRLQR
jgi:protein TonB